MDLCTAKSLSSSDQSVEWELLVETNVNGNRVRDAPLSLASVTNYVSMRHRFHLRNTEV